ncbi:MAG: PmbA protein [Chlamydiales bacterium]|jgi:PmbA protein
MSSVKEQGVFEPALAEATLEERCAHLVERATAQGADEAEVYGTWSESISVRFEKGDLKLTQVDESGSVGLRVFKDKKLGFSSTNQTGEDSLAAVARDALTLASFSIPDDANVLPGARPVPAAATLVTPAAASFSVEQTVEAAREMFARATAVDPRVAIDTADLSISRVVHGVVSSRGVRASESDAMLSCSLFGMAVDGDDVGGFDYWGDFARDPANWDAVRDAVVAKFTDAVLGNLDAQRAETYTGAVLFAPQALVPVLISPLLSASSAIAVQRGRSALAEKVGKEIASPSLSIVDDPTDRSLAGATSFDREGTPVSRFNVLEKGVLQSYLYNGYAAQVEGRESTGHARGGARSVPGLGAHSLIVSGGDGGDQDALLARLGRGLFVQRFSGSVDPASGDFSGVAKSARWVENGKVVRSLRETLIAGNAFELLRSIDALSTDTLSLGGSMRAPWAIVDGLSVTAG